MVHSAQGGDWSAFQRPIAIGDISGLSFAYTRVSDWGSGGRMGVDPTFRENWNEIKAAGKHRGAYWYLLPQFSAKAQAEFFCAAVKSAGLRRGDMLVCDSEELATNSNLATFTFCDMVDRLLKADGAITQVYTNNNVGQHLKSCTKWPLWFAHPASTWPSGALILPWDFAAFWQYGTKPLPGEQVDTDAFNGTAADLDKWVAKHSGQSAPDPGGKPPKPPAFYGEDTNMQLNQGMGAKTAVSVPPEYGSIHIMSTEPVNLSVALNSIPKAVTKQMDGNSATTVAVPEGIHGAIITRLDAGLGGVTVALGKR